MPVGRSNQNNTRGIMYHYLIIICLLCSFSAPAHAIHEKLSEGFQMDTNMSKMPAYSQNDSTLRFLQTLTNQQEEIQNLNLSIQKNARESKIQKESLDHRISFLAFLLWGILAVNVLLFFFLVIMGLRMRALSKKVNKIQAVVRKPFVPNDQAASPQTDKSPPIIPFDHLEMTEAEEKELESILTTDSSENMSDLPDNAPEQQFFHQFQNEIDRERSQLNPSRTSSKTSNDKEKSENDLLDELIDQHFSDADMVSISRKS